MVYIYFSSSLAVLSASNVRLVLGKYTEGVGGGALEGMVGEASSHGTVGSAFYAKALGYLPYSEHVPLSVLTQVSFFSYSHFYYYYYYYYYYYH